MQFLRLDLDRSLSLDPDAGEQSRHHLVRLIAGNPVTMGQMPRHVSDAADCQDKLHHRSCRGRWRSAVSLGYGLDGKRLRRKVSGAAKQEVPDKLRLVHAELEDGVKSPARYTLGRAIDDWLREGLDGRSVGTVRLNRDLLAPVSVSTRRRVPGTAPGT